MTARRYLVLAALATALAVAAGSCSRRSQPPSRQSSRRPQPTPEEFFRSVLPASWEMKVEEKTVPVFWIGPRSCKCITLTNPSEAYYRQYRSDSYDMIWQKYVPCHQFWFCPRDWKGAAPYEDMFAPFGKYPARYLCQGQRYTVYSLRWVDLSNWTEGLRFDLPDKVKEAFGKPLPPGAPRVRRATP
jgi:hypothetical protein